MSIHHLPQGACDDELFGWAGPGWYVRDGVENLHGPFTTPLEAQLAERVIVLEERLNSVANIALDALGQILHLENALGLDQPLFTPRDAPPAPEIYDAENFRRRALDQHREQFGSLEDFLKANRGKPPL